MLGLGGIAASIVASVVDSVMELQHAAARYAVAVERQKALAFLASQHLSTRSSDTDHTVLVWFRGTW